MFFKQFAKHPNVLFQIAHIAFLISVFLTMH